MVKDAFLEISFPDHSSTAMEIEGRDEVEDPIDDALKEAGIGKVTGGGGGWDRGFNIDVEIEDERNLAQALQIIRQVLKDLKASPEATITHRDGNDTEYSIYE